MSVPPLATRRRLTSSADFDAVHRRGRSRSSRHLVAWRFPRVEGDGEPMRLGVTVPRKVGGAVVRNRVKRQLREAAARLPAASLAGVDVVLVARPGAAEAIESGGFDWLVGELARLLTGTDDAGDGAGA